MQFKKHNIEGYFVKASDPKAIVEVQRQSRWRFLCPRSASAPPALGSAAVAVVAAFETIKGGDAALDILIIFPCMKNAAESFARLSGQATAPHAVSLEAPPEPNSCRPAHWEFAALVSAAATAADDLLLALTNGFSEAGETQATRVSPSSEGGS